MNKPIDWQAMSHDELESALEEGREEATRRAQRYLELLGIGGSQAGKRGRKAANPLASLFGGEDPETPESVAANGAAS